MFTSQAQFSAAFKAGELYRDVVVVVRQQGPRANGMPELHGLTPALSVMMARGHRVALVTDGRMSGASGKIPAAIHVTPEAAAGGPLALVRDGDPLRLDCDRGTLDVLVDPVELAGREPLDAPAGDAEWVGTGRELFAALRHLVGRADHGASLFAASTPVPSPSELPLAEPPAAEQAAAPAPVPPTLAPPSGLPPMEPAA